MSGEIGVIIQARMRSTRLPGKILKKLGGKTLLEHIFFRLSFLRHSVGVVLATSDMSDNDVVSDLCLSSGIACFRGSEDNVLDRYIRCAEEYDFKHIVRLTADNPLVDIEELDRLIELYLLGDIDYADSLGDLPIGVGAEIFSMGSLIESGRLGKEPHHIEHVNEYIRENMARFKCARLPVPPEKSRPDVRLTLDTEDDYLKISYIVDAAGDEFITTQEAIALSDIYDRKGVSHD